MTQAPIEEPAGFSAPSIKLPRQIFGMHDPGEWRRTFEEADRTGWVMFNQVVDREAAEKGSRELAEWAEGAEDGYGVLARLVNAPFDPQGRGNGSIPLPDEYDDFASRCAEFVRRSPGCRIWFVGNEVNVQWHWPSSGRLRRQPTRITPEQYAECFHRVYQAIKAVQADAWVIPSGLNPLRNPGVEFQDGLKFFGQLLDRIRTWDGFDIHAYFPSAGGEEGSASYLFEDFMALIPRDRRELPVFITEATPPAPWPNRSDGWMQRTYAAINRWNHNPDRQPVYALLPYRWRGEWLDGRPDPWNLAEKPSYLEDLRAALRYDYRWLLDPASPAGPPLDRAAALARIRLIRSSLFDVEADALVNPTNVDMDLMGEISRSLREYLNPNTLGKVQSAASVELGEAMATEAGMLPARHVLHVPIGVVQDSPETADNLARAARAALELADRLGDVRHVAFPAIGTGTAHVDPDRAAAITLPAVLDYLQGETRLKRVSFALIDAGVYQAYADRYRALGGRLSPDEVGLEAPAEYRIRIAQVGLPEQIESLKPIKVPIRLGNDGSVPWRAGERLRIACVWRPREKRADQVEERTFDWEEALVEDVQPGATVEFEISIEQPIALRQVRREESEVPEDVVDTFLDGPDVIPPGECQVRWSVLGLDWGDGAEPAEITQIVSVSKPSFRDVTNRIAEELLDQVEDHPVIKYLDAVLGLEDEGKNGGAEAGPELTRLIDSILSVAYSPDGSCIVSGSRNHVVQVWDAKTVQELTQLTGHNGPVLSVAYSPDGSRIVSGSADLTVRVWDAEMGQELTQLTGHTRGVNAVAYSPDGSRIVSGSADQTVRVWDVETGQELAQLTGHSGWVSSVAYSPDGGRIVSGGEDQVVWVWDAERGQELVRLTGPADSVLSVAYSPDGRHIVSGSADQTVRVWDVDTGQELTQWTGHNGPVLSVAYSPDGSRIVSGSADQTVRVWDAETGQELTRLTDHIGRISPVAYSPDGRHIVSGGEDGMVQVFDASGAIPAIVGDDTLAMPVYVVSDGVDLNIREAPDTAAAVITRIPGGTMLEALGPRQETEAKLGVPGEWLRVRASDGTVGYAAAWYLGLSPQPEVPAETPGPTFEGILEDARAQIRSTDSISRDRIAALNSVAGHVRDDRWDTSERIQFIQVMWDAFDTGIEPYRRVRRSALRQLRSLSEDEYGEWVQQALAARTGLHPQIVLALSDDYIAEGDREWLRDLLVRVGVSVPEPPPVEEETPVVEAPVDETPETAVREAPMPPQELLPAPRVPPQPAAAPQVVYAVPEPPRDGDVCTIHIREDVVTLNWGDASKAYKSPNLLRTFSELKKEQYLSPRAYGTLLFKGIIHHQGSTGYEDRSTLKGYDIAKYEAEKAGGKLRVILQVDVGSEYPAYRWEYITDPGYETPTPLAVFEKQPFFRLHGGSDGKPVVPARPLRILVAICDPVDLEGNGLADLDPVVEQNILKKAMAPLVKNGLVKCDVLVGTETGPVTLDRIKEVLQDGRYHVLHLLAHGVYRKLAESRIKCALVLEDADRCMDYVYAHQLKNAIIGQDLRLAVLASCLSGKQEIGGVLDSMASYVITECQVPAVIAMQDYMPIEGVQILTKRFYGDLARSGRIDMAMAATRSDLYARDPDSWLWGIPILLMNTTDARLFDVDEDLARTVFRPEKGTLDVKTYKELGGTDPTARRVASALEAEMRNYGYGDQGMINVLRSAIAPGLISAPARSEPIAPPQDRSPQSALGKLKLGVSLKADDLETYVRNHSGLELQKSTWRQVASTLNAGKHIILIGPHGTGKTSLAQDICSYARERGFTAGFVPATATADWTTFDTVGGYVPTGERTLEFRPGVFLEAINTGKWLVIDEINRAEIDKAFGELFTVLSGQSVDLPYKVAGDDVRVLPPAKRREEDKDNPTYWIPTLATSSYHYVIHPNWRIIGTMNVYDKSSLFQMSFAFMRRFAFVDVNLPSEAVYHYLVDKWLEGQKILLAVKQGRDEGALVPEEQLGPLQQAFRRLLDRTNSLMKRRALGPAITKDMIEYIGDRYRIEERPAADGVLLKMMGEAFLLYVVPQLDGLDFEGILEIYRYIKQSMFADLPEEEQEQILTRVRLLYPHIKNWDKDG